jgi:hypothetical protein
VLINRPRFAGENFIKIERTCSGVNFKVAASHVGAQHFLPTLSSPFLLSISKSRFVRARLAIIRRIELPFPLVSRKRANCVFVARRQAVKFLLDYVDRRRVYQALLAAINLGNEEIAELIIEHPKYEEISADLKRHGKAFFYQNKFNDDNQFSEEITPLILAAQQNRFEVSLTL